MNTKLKRVLIVTGIFFFIGAAALPAYYFYDKYQKVLGTQTTAEAQKELQKVKEEVGKLIELPEDEPVLATVSDAEKLKNQPFFLKSQNGDKVLIYEKAKKAYMYRPSTNKLIEVTNLSLQGENNTPNTNPQTQPQEEKKIEAKIEAETVDSNTSDKKVEEKKVKTVIRNGTSTVGITSKIESEISNLVSNIEVTDKEDAVRKDYEKTLVISLNANGAPASEEIAKNFNTVVSELPDNEKNPEGADLLIIVGKDKVSK